MTKILEFRPRPAREGGGRSRSQPAEIVIFPGVRYERMDSGPTAKARKAPRGKQPERTRRQG